MSLITFNVDSKLAAENSESFIKNTLKLITQSTDDDEPFRLVNISDIISKYKDFRQLLPRVSPFYAVKCNSNIIILKVLAALGVGFDCASKNEIQKVLSLDDVQSNQIIFANTIKSESHIKYAASVNVDTMTFDNEAELYKIHKLYPKVKLLIRINCDDDTSNYKFGNKFGCDAENESFDLLCLAQSLQLNVVGVAFHVGSDCHNYVTYKRAIEMAQKVFAFGESCGFDMYILDIGGGFPGYNQIEFQKICKVINEALDELFPLKRNSISKFKVIAEPGRYFVESAVTAACRIVSMKKTEKNMSTSMSYYLNDGVCGSFVFLLIFNCKSIEFKYLKDIDDPELYPSIMYGPTCWGNDIIKQKTSLPELKLGDWLYVENMGAYSEVLSTKFNGFQVLNVHGICKESEWNQLKSSFSNLKYDIQQFDDFIILNKHLEI